MRFRPFLSPRQQFLYSRFFPLRAIQPEIKFGSPPQPQAFHQFMPNILLGCEQALETSFCFLVIAIHIHENLRGTAIIGDDDRSYGRKSDSRVRLPPRFRFPRARLRPVVRYDI